MILEVDVSDCDESEGGLTNVRETEMELEQQFVRTKKRSRPRARRHIVKTTVDL